MNYKSKFKKTSPTYRPKGVFENINSAFDDINFSNAAKELFMRMEKSLDFPENFYVFNTSDAKLKGGVKVKI